MNSNFSIFIITHLWKKFSFVVFSIAIFCFSINANAQWVTNVGPNPPSSSSSSGTNKWVSTPQVFSSNNNYAAVTINSGTVVISDDIIITNFGFSVPTNSVITGVVVGVEKSASHNSGTQYIQDNAILLVNAGTDLSTTNKANTATKWSTSDATVNYGSSTDVWGATLTPAIINSSTFGIRFKAAITRSTTNVSAYIDFVQITISYEMDTDGDGIVNSQDIDCDNDGIPDFLEYTSCSGSSNLQWNAYANGTNVTSTSLTSTPVTITTTVSSTVSSGSHAETVQDFSAYTGNKGVLQELIPTSTSSKTTMIFNFTYPVEGLQFKIMDLDGSPDPTLTVFQDSVKVTFYYKNIPFTLSSTNYITNLANTYVGNNTFAGRAGTNSTVDGNVDLIMPYFVDKVVIEYWNNNSNLGYQWTGISGFSFCHINGADVDADAVPNFVDLDSDNDGVPDVIESYGVDADGNGRIDNFVDANSNGLSDNVETFGTVGLGLQDLDGDGVPNYLDLDSDNDGIPDILEAEGTDSNNDGKVDGFTDSNVNGYQDALDGAAALIKSGADTNGDGLADSWPNKNLDQTGKSNPYDLDSDGDGVLDLVEAGLSGTNGIASGTLGSDGWSNTVDALASLSLPNTDGVGKSNYLDIDSDNDGITDNVEAQATLSYVVASDVDTDSDGIADVYETGVQVGIFGGGGLTPFDFDGDTTPDYVDTDSDNDTKPDRYEGVDRNYPGLLANTQADINSSGDSDGDGLMNLHDNTDLLTALSSGNMYKNISMGNMGPGGNFAGPTPTGSKLGLPKSDPLASDRDWRNATILPLNIVKFAAVYNEPTAKLSWSVENEYQTSKYAVEYSVDGISFEKVGEVMANNTGKVEYSFNHVPNKNVSTVYYRIKQIDKSGKEFYSKTVAIKLGKAAATVSVYPNPFVQYMNVSIGSQVEETVVLQLISTDGKIAKTINGKLQKGLNTLQMTDLSNMAKGNYYLRISSNNIQTTQQVIKIN